MPGCALATRIIGEQPAVLVLVAVRDKRHRRILPSTELAEEVRPRRCTRGTPTSADRERRSGSQLGERDRLGLRPRQRAPTTSAGRADPTHSNGKTKWF